MPFSRAFFLFSSGVIAARSENLRVVKTDPLVNLLHVGMIQVCIYGAVIGRNKTNVTPTGHWWKAIAPPGPRQRVVAYLGRWMRRDGMRRDGLLKRCERL
jgi:hypothetical protein